MVFGFIEAGIVKIINEYRGTNETTQEFLDNVFIISKALNPSEVIVIDDPTSCLYKAKYRSICMKSIINTYK
jgi:hypothetical protein